MGTLTPHITAYLRDVRTRGRMQAVAITDARYTLRGLDGTHGDRPLRSVADSLQRWEASIGHLAPATRRAYRSRAVQLLRWMHRRQLLRADPTLDLEPIRQPPPVERYLSVEDARATIAAAPDARARAVLWLLWGCGLRCCEVSRAGVGDWHRRDGILEVRGKGGRGAVTHSVPVPQTVSAALADLLAAQPATAGPLIRSRVHPHRGVAPKTISGWVRRWMRAASVKAAAGDGRSAHALRHAAACDLLDAAGGDPTVPQQALGHRHLSTTARYLRRDRVERVRAAMEGRDWGEAA